MAKKANLVIPLMKHILFFVESLSGGGAEKVLVTLLRHLDQRKYSITLVTLVDTGILREEIDTEKISYRPVIRPSSNPFVSLWNKAKYKLIYKYLPVQLVCKWIIPQKSIDLYVAFTEGFATKLLAFAPGPKLTWVHTNLKDYPWTQDKKIYRTLQEEIAAYRQFNAVVCVSGSVAQVMKGFYGIIPVRTLLNPVDTFDIVEKSNEPLGEKVRGSAFRIVSIGRLIKQKGYDKLIPIIRRLIDRNHDVVLYLIGEGEEKDSLVQLVNDHHLNDYVYFTGYLNNPYPLLKQMDLFVCSSLAEGFSLAVAEALVLGLPVVSMNCSGPDYLLGDGQYGDLCGSYDELFHAIERAIFDPAYNKHLKEMAYCRARSFNIQETVRQVESLFDETIACPQ